MSHGCGESRRRAKTAHAANASGAVFVQPVAARHRSQAVGSKITHESTKHLFQRVFICLVKTSVAALYWRVGKNRKIQLPRLELHFDHLMLANLSDSVRHGACNERQLP